MIAVNWLVKAFVDATLAQDPRALNIGHAAATLGLSVRTLIRRLRAQGTSFQTLRDAARRALALRLLDRPGMTIEEISVALGFSDPANFSRAFKRWFGMPPLRFRRERSRGQRVSGA